MLPRSVQKPGNKISNHTREGGALTYTTAERRLARANRSVSVDGDIMESLGYPFDIPLVMEVKNQEREHLELSGNAIKVFFFVFINVS